MTGLRSANTDGDRFVLIVMRLVYGLLIQIRGKSVHSTNTQHT